MDTTMFRSNVHERAHTLKERERGGVKQITVQPCYWMVGSKEFRLAKGGQRSSERIS